MFKVIVYIALLSFCYLEASPYPMGLTKELWESLDKEKQVELILEEKRQIHEKEILAKKEEILNKEQNKSDIEEQNPQYGDIVVVNFNSGLTKHNKYKKNILPQSFLIEKGETKEVELQLQKEGKNYIQTETIFLHYASSGMQIEIFAETPNDRRKRITLLNKGRWNKGENYKNLNVESSKYIALYNVDVSVRFLDEERRYRQRRHYRK